MSLIYLAQFIGEHHIPSTTAYPPKQNRANTVLVTRFKLCLSLVCPNSSEGCITVVLCNIIRYQYLSRSNQGTIDYIEPNYNDSTPTTTPSGLPLTITRPDNPPYPH